ncbi:MAG: uracil-DNA glycosylase [Nitrososphaera sp.]
MGDKKIIPVPGGRTVVTIVFPDPAQDGEKLREINARVVSCRLCPRLSDYIARVGREKVRRHAAETYWARPLPSFGDPRAKLLLVGLAPAAHGGNRTGRMFTGDGSGDWVAKVLYRTGFASIPTSTSIDDGLELRGAYITAAVRCAPPGNKPLPHEMASCAQYLSAELAVLRPRVVMALGKIAFDSYCKAAGMKGLKFSHGARYDLSPQKTLVASYHPSRQNTNTGKLTWEMWLAVFRLARRLVEGD